MPLNLFSATTQTAFTCLHTLTGGIQGYAEFKQATCNSIPFLSHSGQYSEKQVKEWFYHIAVSWLHFLKSKWLQTLALNYCLSLVICRFEQFLLTIYLYLTYLVKRIMT